jgi:hypothetical protein
MADCATDRFFLSWPLMILTGYARSAWAALRPKDKIKQHREWRLMRLGIHPNAR